MLKSYYEILNVPYYATKEEIKAQFKKLVKLYHPDINKSLDSEIIFKQINMAAQVLLDDEKRKTYDNLRQKTKIKDSKIYNYKNPQYKNPSNKTDFSKGISRGFYDLFKKSQSQKKQPPKPKKGDDIFVTVEIDCYEALLGTQRCVNISKNIICPKCLSKKYINGEKCSFCDGLGQKSENKKITVKIPPKITSGMKLRIKGEGKQGQNGGENGNLYVKVIVKKEEKFIVRDGIVYYTASISPIRAILGGNVTIDTLWGEATIKIPPLTKNNQSFKLIDIGLKDDKTLKNGEMIVKVSIEIPESITKEEQNLYRELEKISLKKI